MAAMTVEQALDYLMNLDAKGAHRRAEHIATIRAEIARLEAVEKAAHQWWDGKRPLFELGCERYINPRVNCVTDGECALADALAAMGVQP